MMIDDIKRGIYKFTDGNGFISKGLAKHVAEILSLCPKTLQENVNLCLDSIVKMYFSFKRFFHRLIKFEWLVVKVFL